MIAIKFVLGLTLLFIIIFVGVKLGNRKLDHFMIVLIFALLGIRSFFSVIPDNIAAIRYLQGSWYFYITDIPIIYFFSRYIKNNRYIKVLTCTTITERLAKIYIIFALFSIFQAANVSAAFWGVANIIKLFFLYIIFAKYISLEEERKYIIKGIIISVWFQCTIGIIQKVKGGMLGLAALGEAETAFRSREIGGTISQGIAGTFAHSADMAIFLLFAFLILLFNECFINKIKLFITISVAFISLYFCGSRTVLLLTICIVLFYYVKNIKRKMKIWNLMILISVPVIGVIIWFVLGADIRSLFVNSDFDFQILNRVQQWIIGINEIVKKPILGHGINNYSDWMRIIYPTLYSSNFYYRNPIHNSYLQIWYDVGIFGLIIYVLMLISNIFIFCRKEKKDGLVWGSFLFVCFVLVYNFTGWALIKEPITNMLWIAMGLINNSRVSVQNVIKIKNDRKNYKEK